jgi:hypothetical protein
MNYILEDNFDFYGELNDLSSNETTTNICMVSHEPLTYNTITRLTIPDLQDMVFLLKIHLHNIEYHL